MTLRYFLSKFSPNLMNGEICEGGTRTKHALLRRISSGGRQGLMVGEAHLIGEANIFNVK